MKRTQHASPIGDKITAKIVRAMPKQEAESGEKCKFADTSPSSRSIGPFIAGSVAVAAAARALWKMLRRPATPPRPEARNAAANAAYAREWLSVDPDTSTREEVRSWMDSANTSVGERLAPSANLSFGTAGLRAGMGAGYDRMNAYTVICATEAVLKVMREDFASFIATGGVAIGFDGRHNSRKFAIAAARVFADAGVPVRLFSKPVPTPLVAFAVLEYGLAASIMITASHNPARDNGYKLFWKDGSQIRPDIANRIESHFRRTRASKYVLDEALLRSMSLVSDPTESCIDSYMSVAQTLRWRPREENSEAPACVYTAMHGVGFPFVSRLFADFGLLPVVPVEVQSLKPDPDFSTVTKPNPEESGALDLAIAKAKETNVSVVIANDPDADRLGAAVVDVESGSTRILTGNEIAALLADYLLLQQTPSDRAGIAMVRSTVSSRFLSSMGKREGFQVEETLTGFKWLSFGAANLAKDGKTCLLAYEEALGYMIGTGVRDKDGVSAAAVFAELAGYWAKQGGVLQRLATLNELYGNHLCNNGYLTLTDSSTPLESIFEVARAEGFPSVLGKSSVVSVRDLTKGTDTAQSDGRAVLPADPNTQFLTFTCKSPLATDGVDDMTISLRGSGTEPKVKYYSEIRVSGAETKRGDEVLRDACEAAIAAVLKPEANNLTR